MDLIRKICPNNVLQAAYQWLGKKRISTNNNNSIWHLRFKWQSVKKSAKKALQSRLLDNSYRLSLFLSPLKRWRGLLPASEDWRKRLRKRIGVGNERSAWWGFVWEFDKQIENWLQKFRFGLHQFSPMIQYRFTDEVIRVWSYLDRLIIHLLLTIIRPTFKHIISPLCLHLAGPSAIKGATAQIKAALNSARFNYCLRVDIKSYYASINHQTLINQLTQNFDDPLVLKYLEDIVTIGVDCGGQVILQKQGLPLRSALSPFFGALYLSDLDKAFTKRKGVFYLRYMDDIIILVETKRQYLKARKRLFTILRNLRLKVSPHKTRMGALNEGFHFLGVNFAVSRNTQSKSQVVTVKAHSRTPRRALDKVKAMRSDAVHPATMQRYLTRWATWWHQIIGLKIQDLIFYWVYCAGRVPELVWLGRGLLLGFPAYALNPIL